MIRRKVVFKTYSKNYAAPKSGIYPWILFITKRKIHENAKTQNQVEVSKALFHGASGKFH